ncbi:coproporphyrinogen dehydrogenase HemZ [Acetobacterium woodii]|uniref:Oxygen-independent coproporphyrinogen-III oxidase 2 n=1 Tax=Acetobacterium woodii (strain ATCC 29683 / DSM 1030 / JCM 2381 / KCTC 1655 / WB1) TaxID=931626 RepID=H6LC02_ACEWD|nr:coproporphyrinogen dehydrogenase HemZ [Acetobacterium woodii]AFA48950.1 oxygen-independent coproporphyrinogen-III oxidase 2 [Acetobacterium woodii DSM 1030]
MRILRFDLQRPELEYYFHELYQAFDPGVKNILSGNADGVLLQKTEEDTVTLQLNWYDEKKLTRTYQFMKNDDPLDNSVYKGFFYDFLCEYFDKKLEWGTLTGIKPVKMVFKYLNKGWSQSAIRERFSKYYRVSYDRIDLMLSIANRQADFIVPTQKKGLNKSISIYVGIPLCPSKCDYCSFVSTIVDKNADNLTKYFTHLLAEIQRTGEVVKAQGFRIDTLYIGGGTPTVLNARQLDQLMTALENAFDLSQLREYTLEAGRAETINREKLAAAKAHGVERVCLNPQSMNQQTLINVKRPWEAGLIEKQVALIKSFKFKTLNMDLIVGLGDETADDFRRSLEMVIALEPENITIHNLSIKKGSRIKDQMGIVVKEGYGEAFYQAVKQRLNLENYQPYYLYRLKYTQDNSENIGYAKPGHEGIYNILMMSECQATIGIGAGATGNLYYEETDEVQKVFTVKDVKTYNERFEEIVTKKIKAYQIYFNHKNNKF